jgi:type IV pilus assembly protein PilA
MRQQRGFSLIELLIVIAIILIIAVITVPNLLRARIAANETSAAQSVRQISTAETSYHITFPQFGYAPDLASLGGPVGACAPTPAAACILDSVVSSGKKSGYQFFAAGFAFNGSPINTQFVASSAPSAFNKTGVRNFCVATDDGAVRARAGIAGGIPAPDVPTCLAYGLLN